MASKNFFSKSEGSSNQYEQNSTVATPEMCFFCFDVLHKELSMLDRHVEPNHLGITNSAFPLFVTWTIGRDKRLRGCIGTFSELSLQSGLKEYALTSALKDSRFDPISPEEVPRLSVSVSILQGFEEARDYLDWTLGVHGIRIEFCNERGSRRSATYLPKVATEQGWNKIETIDSLMRKGGFRGQISDAVRNTIKLTRYTSQEIHMNYPTYVEYRDRFQANGFITCRVQC